MGDFEYDQQHPRELIKCVLIGDSGVGKTKLILAEAAGVGMKTERAARHLHYPSVFAIDQYHVSKEIRDRASFVVDDVNIALRLWDTFGDHGMNRKFAYQNANVVMLCFNISSPCSFKNVNAVWYPEIRKFCPRTPIILVGTHADWRYHSDHSTTTKDKYYSLSKRMRECALVSPDMGRQVAKEIGATYYESSVVTMWGVKEAFENAIRLALIARRQTRFWSSHLKKVLKPLLQQPFLPEKSCLPSVEVPVGQYQQNLQNLIENGACTDVHFILGQHVIEAHSVILSCISPLFSQLLLGHGLFDSLAEESYLLKCLVNMHMGEEVKFFQNATVLGKQTLLPRGFSSINLMKGCGDEQRISSIVIEVDSSIPLYAFQGILSFLYSSSLPKGVCMEELLNVAKYLQLKNMTEYIMNILNNSAYMNTEVYSNIQRHLLFSSKILVDQKCMSDVAFILHDKTVHAHKCFLVSQCEMMAAMFMEGHFKESGHQVVELKHASYQTFLAVLEFLYTGHCPVLVLDEALDVIGLANFFCLPRLVALCEKIITKELQVNMATDELSVSEDVIACLKEAQLHNASQLEAWCLCYLATHYDKVCQHHPKEFKTLSSATHHCLNKQRWPPIWYLLENDWYEKAKRENDQQEQKKRPLKSTIKGKRKKCHCL